MTRVAFFAASVLLLVWTLALMLGESPDALVTDQRAPGVHATPYRETP